MSDAETPSIDDAELAEESVEDVLEEELPQPELLHGVPVSASRVRLCSTPLEMSTWHSLVRCESWAIGCA